MVTWGKVAIAATVLPLTLLVSPVAASGLPRNAAQASAAAAGYDISYPQCGGGFPTAQSFGIVGVNDGLANLLNPCLGPSTAYPLLADSELYWATTSSVGLTNQPGAQLDVNTADPGNIYQGTPIGDWPTSGSTPYGTCSTIVSGGVTVGANSPACAFQYGYNKASQDATWLTSAATAVNALLGSSTPIPTTPGSYPWWLDVETANTWQSGSTGQAMNIADLQGMAAALAAAGVSSIGIYSDTTQWQQITGVTTPSSTALGSLYGAPVWVPGALSLTGAVANCSGTSFTGGTVDITQWNAGSFDQDYSCSGPVPPAAIGSSYTSLSPSRLLDTRVSGQTLPPQGTLNLTVAGMGSVPATATAVALNVTATNTSAAGYLSVYPAGGTPPLVSNLNWTAGETVANLVVVPVGTGGQVTIYNYTGSTNVIVDLEGYFGPEATGSTAGSYVALTPARITDTRSGSGYPNSGNPLAAGATLNVQVTGAGGVPTSGVAAALLNVTVTGATASSYLTVYPEGIQRPVASNLNWTSGDTVAARVVVPVSASGQISLYNYAGEVQVVVDVNGYFTNGTTAPTGASLYYPITPIRVVDTRSQGGTLTAGAILPETLGGLGGVSTHASAVILNVTAANTTATSYFTVYPGPTRPVASDLNWAAGQVVPNLTVATLNGSGGVNVYNNSGSADVVMDAFGYFMPSA